MQAVNSYMNKDEERTDEVIGKDAPLNLPKHKLKVQFENNHWYWCWFSRFT